MRKGIRVGNTPKLKPTTKTRPAAIKVGSPWPHRLLMAGAAALVVLIVVAILVSEDPVRGIPDGTMTVEVGPPEHIEGDIYAEGEVPAGGAHDPVWANCGFYDSPIRTENVVHALEHGAVWITYLPDLDPEEIDRLRGFARNAEKVLVSTMQGQDAPVMATAWGYQLLLDDAADP
ncbi:MAG: DUF3105 domain-containing protein, partial [Acidimicrobiia bacterium]|nr:DUF3105 domain-containing protein [Acidimicrobiia bacterium]